MTTTSRELTELRSTLDGMLAPLRQRLKTLDESIAEHEGILEELRAARTQARRAVVALDPEGEEAAAQKAKYANNKKAPTDRARASEQGVSQDRLAEVEKFLRDNQRELETNGGFYAAGLSRHPGFMHLGPTESARSQLANNAFKVLHDRGVIRLDHKGSGGAKYYKLVQ